MRGYTGGVADRTHLKKVKNGRDVYITKCTCSEKERIFLLDDLTQTMDCYLGVPLETTNNHQLTGLFSKGDLLLKA